jgi:phosphoribosyl 1,2-cyclic phosphodiesterase
MAMRFCILGSGSAGNCAFLQTDGCRALIDAGFSARRLGEMLAGIGESFATLDAIFLTHEHGDHAAGLAGLRKFPDLKVFANAATANSVQLGLEHRLDWQIFETGSRFRFADLTIDAFPVPHDAADPVGFVFSTGNGDFVSPRRSLGWLTDLGHAPALVQHRVREVDVLVLEANYDDQMLRDDTKRPWSVKQRIAGRHGHLSNQGAREFVSSVAGAAWRDVYLAHLSRDCNSLAAVEREFAPLAGGRFRINTVPSGGGCPLVDLG